MQPSRSRNKKKNRRGTRADRAAAKAAAEFGVGAPRAAVSVDATKVQAGGPDVHVLHIVRGLPGSRLEHYAAKLAYEAKQAGLKVAVFGTPIEVAGGPAAAAREFRYEMRKAFRKALKDHNVIVLYDMFPKAFMYEGYIADCSVPRPEYGQAFAFVPRVHRVELGPVPSLKLARLYAKHQNVFPEEAVFAIKLAFELVKDETVFARMEAFAPTT